MNCRDPWELGFTLWLQTPPHYMGTVEWRQRKGYSYDNFFIKVQGFRSNLMVLMVIQVFKEVVCHTGDRQPAFNHRSPKIME